MRTRTVIAILLLSALVRVGFCQSAHEPKRSETAIVGVVLKSDQRCSGPVTIENRFRCRSSDFALASGGKTYLLFGNIERLKDFEHKRVNVVGSLEEEPIIYYGTHLIIRKLVVHSIDTVELNENQIELLVNELRVVPWRGPKNYCSPPCWDFGFTDPMGKILESGSAAQRVLLRHLGDTDIQDQVVMLLGSVGDEHAIGLIIETLVDGIEKTQDAKTQRSNLIGNLALTNLTVSEVIWHHGGGITVNHCPDAPKSCWTTWWKSREDTFKVGIGGDRRYSNYPNYGIYAQFEDFSAR